MISNVYQYYMSQYGHKVNAKHDAHTKNQLKNTYNKVIKMNSQSPTYKLDISEDAQKYAIDLKERARELSQIADELSDTEDGSMAYKKTATSSNEQAVHAEYLRNGSPMESTGFQIEVFQLATNQVNTGNYLQPNQALVSAGTYSFDLTINNLTYEFEFDVDLRESANEVQNKISRLINRSNIGLSSEVLTDQIGNTAIQISSEATGLPDASASTLFKIQANGDALTEKNFNLVSALGLDHIAQYPSNAVMTINGEPRISPTNKFTIGKAFAVTLQEITSEPVEIGLQTNADSIAESITELMSGYNNIFALTKDQQNEQFEGNEKLQKEFLQIAKAHRSDLGQNGILVNDSGEIQVDKDMIATAAEEGLLDNVFQSLDTFKQALQKKAEDISLNPMNYVNNKMIAYKNPHRPLTDPYNLSAYTGMMFNGYI